MDDFFESIFLGLIAVSIGLFLGFILLFIRKQRNSKCLPNDKQKQEAFKSIEQWKIIGFDYSKRLDLLTKQGYTKDVANSLLGEFESSHRNA